MNELFQKFDEILAELRSQSGIGPVGEAAMRKLEVLVRYVGGALRDSIRHVKDPSVRKSILDFVTQAEEALKGMRGHASANIWSEVISHARLAISYIRAAVSNFMAGASAAAATMLQRFLVGIAGAVALDLLGMLAAGTVVGILAYGAWRAFAWADKLDVEVPDVAGVPPGGDVDAGVGR